MEVRGSTMQKIKKHLSGKQISDAKPMTNNTIDNAY